MYDGYFKVTIGIMGIIFSFFRKNSTNKDANLFRKYNKQVLVLCGVLMIIFGTSDLVKSFS